MSRKPRIDWSKGGKEELKIAIRNFNAKVNRLAKKNPKTAGALPEKVTLSEFVGTKNKPGLIQTRQDLKREIKALKRFSIRGAEELIVLPNNDYGTKITKWQKREMDIRKSVVNRKRNKQKEMLEQVELESGRKGLGYTLGQLGMGKQELKQLEPVNTYTRTSSSKDIKAKYRSLRKESQSDFYDKKIQDLKDEYIKAMEQSYNHEDIKDVVNTIENMDDKEFFKRFIRAGNTFEISYIKMAGIHEGDDNYDNYLNLLKSTWMPDKTPTGLAKQARQVTKNDKIKGKKIKTKKV